MPCGVVIIDGSSVAIDNVDGCCDTNTHFYEDTTVNPKAGQVVRDESLPWTAEGYSYLYFDDAACVDTYGASAFWDGCRCITVDDIDLGVITDSTGSGMEVLSPPGSFIVSFDIESPEIASAVSTYTTGGFIVVNATSTDWVGTIGGPGSGTVHLGRAKFFGCPNKGATAPSGSTLADPLFSPVVGNVYIPLSGSGDGFAACVSGRGTESEDILEGHSLYAGETAYPYNGIYQCCRDPTLEVCPTGYSDDGQENHLNFHNGSCGTCVPICGTGSALCPRGYRYNPATGLCEAQFGGLDFFRAAIGDQITVARVSDLGDTADGNLIVELYHNDSDTVEYSNVVSSSGQCASPNIRERLDGKIDLIYVDNGAVKQAISSDRARTWALTTIGSADIVTAEWAHEAQGLEQQVAMLYDQASGHWSVIVNNLATDGTESWSSPSSIGVTANPIQGRLQRRKDGVWEFLYEDTSGVAKIVRCSALSSAGAGTWS